MSKKVTIGTDLTQGNVPGNLIKFSLPFMLSNGLQILYSLVDMLVVGNVVGAYGLSAVNISSQIITLFTMICIGFSTSGQVFIAQLIGHDERHRLNSAIGTLYTTVMILSVFITIIGVVLCDFFLQILQTPQEAYDYAKDYLLICSIGIIFTYGYNMVSATLRGMGDSKNPLIFIAIASVINIILDVLFTGYMGMATAGAALATVIGQAVSFIVSLIFLYHRRHVLGFDFKLASFRPHKKTLGILTRLGTPFALQSSAINISMLFVNALINAYAGVFASAAFGVACKVQQLPDIMSRSLGMATSSMAGQNVGAGMLDRAASTVKIAFVLNAIVWVLFSIVYLIFPEAIFRIFNGEAEVLEFAWTCALMLVISAPAHVFLSPGLSFVQAMGDGKFTLIVAIADAFVARVTLSFIFGILFHMGMSGFVMGFNLATYFTGIPVAIYFFSGHWKNRKLLV